MAEAADANGGVKITYFPAAGRAEVPKLCCLIGGFALEEVFVYKTWKEVKPTTPWLSMPFAELNTGETLGQSIPIARYLAKRSGIYPSNFVTAALADQIYEFCEDILKAVPSKGDLSAEDFEKARAEASQAGGAVYDKLMALNKYIGESGWTVGENLSMADVAVFVYVNNIACGFFDHIPGPEVLYADMPNIQRIRGLVANIPAVKARYSAEAEFMGALQAFKSTVFKGVDTTQDTDISKKAEAENPSEFDCKPTLTYFGAPGRAELSRLMLTLKNVEFEDAMLAGPAWGAMKAKGTIPLGNQLPTLALKDVVITQSMAISRYVAAMCGYIPSDPLEEQLCDAMAAGIVDIGTIAYKAQKSGGVEAMAAAWSGESEGKCFMLMQKLEEKVGEEWAVGKAMSWADISLFIMIASAGGDTARGQKLFANFPKSQAIFNKVKANELVKARYQKMASSSGGYDSFLAGAGFKKE